MNCPVCEKNTFIPKTLNQDLHLLECGQCGGYWLKSYHYWLWNEKVKNDLQQTSESVDGLIPADSNNRKICPECFKLLSRYEVGKGTGVTVDRCETCRGIWFDKNEFEIIKSKNILGEIHKIFSSHWQKDVRQEKIRENRIAALTRIIGQDSYDKVAEFLSWIDKNNKASDIMAFINYEISNR